MNRAHRGSSGHAGAGLRSATRNGLLTESTYSRNSAVSTEDITTPLSGYCFIALAAGWSVGRSASVCLYEHSPAVGRSARPTRPGGVRPAAPRGASRRAAGGRVNLATGIVARADHVPHAVLALPRALSCHVHEH